MDIVEKTIEEYVALHSGSVSPLFEELERETRNTTDAPQMLSGKVECLFLRMLIRIMGAARVVEIGTFTGYSALMMAEGLPSGGELFTFESNPRYARIARRYFRRSPAGRKITLVMGNAVEMLLAIETGSVDFIFIDADKKAYLFYYEESIRMLRRGGLIAVDNTLWYGRVLDPQDDNSRAIAEFNETVLNDTRADTVLLTVRDGITLIRKK